MAMRFRKSVKIAPGIRVNLSKSGTSLSVGGKGATMNVGQRGVRTTLGIPGTGLSWSETTGWHQSHNVQPSDEISGLLRHAQDTTNELVRLAESGNRSIGRVNKAIEALNSGRGATAPKRETCKKRLATEWREIEALKATAAEKTRLFEAILGRLNEMSFGLFGGKNKRLRDDAIVRMDSAIGAGKKVMSDLEKVSDGISLKIIEVETNLD